LSNSVSPSVHGHAFIVRIWWEPGLTQPNGRPLWRGQVQHAASGQTLAFQSLDDLMHFIQSRTGDLENAQTVTGDSEVVS
jgi:hypothetical protein